MENEKQFSESESMQVVQRMIATAKNELADDSFYFILWGWLVFVASIGHYLLWQSGYSMPYIVWLLMPAGAVITMIYGKRQGEKQTVKTYIDEVMKYVLIAFGVSLGIVLVFQSKLGINTYPMVMTVYAVQLFVWGGALRFRPLIMGGIINWALGIAGFFVTFEIQLFLLAAAALVGFAIPGHLLKSRFQKSQSVATT
jgi:hypothetical protein